MPGWMNHKLESDMQMMVQSEEELKSLLIRVKKKSERAGLKFNIQKLRSWHLVPSLHEKIDGENVENSKSFSRAPKSLW